MNYSINKKIGEEIMQIDESTAMIRLTALWALSEAGLGGILHLFRTPFTGLLVGGIAVVLLSIMAYVSKNPLKSIPKALLLVIIVKMTISPHSPLPAYFAVAFQGLLAAFLFRFLPNFRLSCILLGFLGMMESALQKIFTLTVLFGKSIWESIDLFIDHVFSKFYWIDPGDTSEGSLWLILFYLLFYAFGGIMIGIIASFIPGEISKAIPSLKEMKLSFNPIYNHKQRANKQSIWKSNKFKFLLILFALILGLYFFVPEAKEIINPFWILIRVVIILLVWFLFIGPYIMSLFQKYLDRKASQYKDDVRQALALIPVFRQLVFAVWESTSHLKGYNRFKTLGVRIVGFALLYKE